MTFTTQVFILDHMSETLTPSQEHKQETWEFQKKPGIPFVDKLKKKHPYGDMIKGGKNVPDFMSFFYDKTFKERSTEELEEQKKLLESVLERNDASPKLRADAGWRKHGLEKELLYRNNPEYHQSRDKAKELNNKRSEDYRKWAKNIRETEGDEVYSKKRKAGKTPNFYTPEELQLDVDLAQMEADAGLSSEVEWRKEIQKAGGMDNWMRQLNKEVLLSAKEGIKSGQNTKDNIKDIDRLLQEGGFIEKEKTASSKIN